jgi:hypothetical protein
MCQLWRNLDAPVAQGRHWTLPVQRMWPLLQNEWPKSTTHQTETKTCKYH